MRHSKARYQLNRSTSWRKATLKSLARSLLLYQSIRTTRVRARAASHLIERLISLGKDNSLSAKRRAFKILGDHNLVSLLFSDIAPRFNNRSSGFTRILPLNSRRGDNASMVIFELTEKKIKKIEKRPKKEKPVVLEKKEGIPPKTTTATAVEEKEKPPIERKPTKGFLRGIRAIFKKERDSL